MEGPGETSRRTGDAWPEAYRFRNDSPVLAIHPSAVMFRPMDSRLRGNDWGVAPCVLPVIPAEPVPAHGGERESMGFAATDRR